MIWTYISQRRQTLRTIASGIGKTAVIYPTAFVGALGVGTVMLGMVFYTNEVFGAGPGQIGFLGASWALAYVVGCLLLRPLCGALLPRYSMLLATALMCLALTATLAAKTLPWLFVFYPLYGLCASLFWSPMMGWLSANVEGKDLSRIMGRFNTSWGAGTVIAPMLAGVLSEIDPALPIRFGALAYLVATCLILGAVLALPNLHTEDHVHWQERRTRTAPGGGSFFRFPAWLGLFTVFCAVGCIANVFPLSAQQDLNLTKSTVGILFLGRALANVIGLGVMGRTRFWHFRGPVMVGGSLFFAAVMFLLIGADSSSSALILLVLGGGLSAQAYASSQFHGVSNCPQRAARMAVHESLLSAGMVIGAACGGWLYELGGRGVVYSVVAVVFLLTAAGQGALLWQRQLPQT